MEKTILVSTVILFVVILAGITLSSCTHQKPIKEEDLGFRIETPKVGEVIPAISLWRAYLANKNTSDAAYKDKIIQVKGIVRFFSPKRKKKDHSYIILEKDKSSFSFIKGIQCQFQGNINEVAPDIKNGDEITIQGTCIGKVVNVFLEDCHIVSGTTTSYTPKTPASKEDAVFTIKTPKEGEIISAVFLWEAYMSSLEKADAVFNQKVIQVKGNILSMGAPRFWRGNTSFIILEVDVQSKSLLKGIQCEFDGNILKTLPCLKKGDEITIQGICSSKFVNVFLKKCSIVK